ncbi:MAG: hypothetical protein JWP87_6234 [Labilithrix sp.]|nr:hypothetical protein [Labilithrix sp.]
MHRHLRFSSYVLSSLALVTALVGCGSSSEEETAVAGPPPNEAVVFDASSDTKADLGIAKWGFATDTDGDLMTYRGYGEKNEVLATVVQKLDRSDPTKYHFTLTMTGPKESASEKIDFSTHPSDDGKDAILVTLVTENTFDEGAVPSRVLAHFKADSASRAGTTIGSGSLTGKSRPLDGNQLVTQCNDTVNRCQTELIDSRIAASAASGDCGLLKMVGQPLISTIVGAGAGALATLWGGPTAVVGAALGGGGALVASGVSAATQCIASRRDATSAAQDLKKCQQEAAACAR